MAASILDVGYFETSLLTDFASDTLLERLIGLEEACDEAVVVATEIFCLDEENLVVATFDSDDDGRRNWGIGLVMARGADA